MWRKVPAAGRRVALGSFTSPGSIPDPDEGHVPPLVPSPMGKEEGVLPCIPLGDAQGGRGHAGPEAPIGQDRPEIKGGGTRGNRKPQGRMHFRAHLVGRCADGGPQVHADVLRPHTEVILQGLESRFQNSLRGSPPSGVEKGHQPRSGLYHEDRHAVRQGNGEEQVRLPGCMPIAGRSQMESRRHLAVHPDNGAVFLRGVDHRRRAGEGPKRIPPGKNLRAGGRATEAKIKGIAAISFGSPPGGDPVD